MKRNLVIAAVVSGLLAFAVWRGCRNTSGEDLSDVPSMRPTRSSENTGAWRAKDPETPEEYAALVRKKSIEAAKRNNVPIAFYGRVVDQDGKPLQGVAVDIIVTAIPAIPVPWGPGKTTKESCVTDQNGLFSIEGKRGDGLDITGLSKQGYRKSGFYNQAHPHYDSYSADRHIPDRDKPVEFMLIRDDLPKAQEIFNRQLVLNWNAGMTTLDFGPDVGKLHFTATRMGRDASNTMKKFEWEANMRAVGFTMAKLPDENGRIAPVTGYVPNCRVGFSPGEKAWSTEAKSSYAILTGGGAYGLINITVYGDGDDGGVCGRVTVYLNKSGARNLDHR